MGTPNEISSSGIGDPERCVVVLERDAPCESAWEDAAMGSSLGSSVRKRGSGCASWLLSWTGFVVLSVFRACCVALGACVALTSNVERAGAYVSSSAT